MNPYIIQKGDTLSALAEQNKTTVSSLLNLNPNIKNPDLIYEGAKLNLGLKPGVGGNTTPNILTPTPTTANTSPMTKPNYIVGSEPVVREEQGLAKQFTDTYGNDEYLKGLKERKAEQDAIFEQEKTRLQANYDAQASEFGRAYDEVIKTTKDEQQKELATNIVGLARIGGYLGGSASSMGAINNLQQKHNSEIMKLEQKRDAAVATAKTGLNDKLWTVVKEQLAAAKEYEKEINDRRENFFDTYVQLSQEDRANKKYVSEEADNLLEKYLDSGLNPSLAEMDMFSKALGTSPDVISSLIKAKRDARELETKKDKIDIDAKILSVLKDVPVGKYVKIGDKMYGGLKSASGSGDGSSVVTTQFDQADKFIKDNKGKFSSDQIVVELRKRFNKLTDGDINSLIRSSFELADPELDKFYNDYIMTTDSKDQQKMMGDLSKVQQTQFDTYLQKKISEAEAEDKAKKKSGWSIFD